MYRVVIETNKINKEVSDLLKERSLLFKVLLQLNFVRQVYESDANFILIKVDDANKRYDQLLEKGIVIRNRSTQPLCENTLRITVGTKEENSYLVDVLKNLDTA